jgi:hypothetical protein
VVVDQDVTDGDSHGERAFELIDDPVRWCALTAAPPLVIAWDGEDGARGHEGGLQALRKGRQNLLASAVQAKTVRHSFLNALTSCSLCFSSCLSTVRCAWGWRGVEEHPALLDATYSSIIPRERDSPL